MTDPRFDDKTMFTPKVMWLAYLISQLLFAGIGWYVVSQQTEAVAGEPIVLYSIAAMGVALPLLTPLIIPLLRAGPPTNAEGQARPTGEGAAMTTFILDLALREAGAIFAFVALIMGATLSIWVAPAAAAFGMTVLAYPTPERFSAWAGPGTD